MLDIIIEPFQVDILY